MQKNVRSIIIIGCCCLATSGLVAQKANKLQPRPALIRLIDANLRQSCNQYKVLMGNVPAGRLPRTYHVNTDRVETSDAGWWTSGFYPGTLLYLYEFSGDTSLLYEALRRLPLLEKEQYNRGTHDLGFMMNCSFGNADRLARGGKMARAEYDTILLNSARSLASRFNPVVGCIRSWDNAPWHYPVIIDNMMNLELLFRATHLSGDSSFYRIAVTHANTTLKNHFRPDHSSFHVVDYDTAGGAIIARKTAQGFSDSSDWARGQAWGLYGYTMSYRCTKDPKYLEQAEAIAGFILDNPRLPADKIPYWDYDAPGILPGAAVNPGVPRDASAAAITASALVELSRYAGQEKGRRYLDAAEAILLSLSSNNYKAIVGSNGGFLLKHSVGNLPGRSEVDVPLTYADYYFVEAMLRYKQLANPAPGYWGNTERMDTGGAASVRDVMPVSADARMGTGDARMVQVAPGWAKNSVNAVIFRHNSIVTYKDTQFIAYYDGDSRLVLGKRKCGDAVWQLNTTAYTGNTADAHNSISLMVDGAGYLHVAWDHHNDPLRYCRGLSPGSLELSGKMPMTGQHEERVTYPDFYRMPDGDLLFLYRDGSSGNGNLVIDRYDTKRQQWEQLQHDLIDGQGRRNAYWQACVDGNGVLHLSWVWRESPDVGSNHDICYARSRDGGVTWETSSGMRYQIPITEESAEYVYRVPMHSGLINQTSMCADAGGRPYIATYWRPAGSAVPQYQLLWHDGAKWNLATITKRLSSFSLEGMGTKRTPISRPQIMQRTGVGGRSVLLVVFRDEERGDRVSVAISRDFPEGEWQVKDLSAGAYDAWEPSYDTELWKQRQELDLFVEKVEQGDGEKTEETAPQMISVLEWNPA